ncbi:MAG: hypothetical protein A2045_08445 [Rhodocyclales bacterium GWA2_65_20]|nr:MAG: hypothetical protein A2045_08445 [Rhodocyclales bacterium GWA2_65_20]
MLARIGSLLLELHHDCRRPAVVDFPQWSMDLVRSAIGFDTGYWGSGCVVDGEVVAHAYWLYRLPAESMQSWEKLKHRDTVSPLLLAQPSRVLNLTNAGLKEQHAFMYENFFRALGIEQFLGTYADNEVTGLFDVLAVYRADPAAPFSEEERQAFEGLVPHLVEARRANYLSHMGAAECQIAAATHQLAAADAKGVLHAAQDGFAALMNLEWPGWRGPRLPDAVGARIGAGRHYVGAAIAIDFEPALDMTLLHARRRSAVDRLSARQLEIARAFASGQSHKEIAQACHLAPATVRNHLAAIYDTLGIGSKAELATLLAQQAHRLGAR